VDEHFHYPGFNDARIQGRLSVQDLWVRYLGVGGNCDIFDIDAHLQGISALDRFEHNTLAYALNERLDELAADAHVPYLRTAKEDPVRLKQAIADLLDEGFSA
jgi:hypothetical protein